MIEPEFLSLLTVVVFCFFLYFFSRRKDHKNGTLTATPVEETPLQPEVTIHVNVNTGWYYNEYLLYLLVDACLNDWDPETYRTLLALPDQRQAFLNLVRDLQVSPVGSRLKFLLGREASSTFDLDFTTAIIEVIAISLGSRNIKYHLLPEYHKSLHLSRLLRGKSDFFITVETMEQLCVNKSV